MLPSGLPDLISDREALSRFLTQSGHYSSKGPRAGAFLPHPTYGNTSVFRVGGDLPLLKRIWAETNPGRDLRAVAVVTAAQVRWVGLDVTPDEPPPRHANIEQWPKDADPELQKSRHKELALELAAGAVLVQVER